MSQKFHQDQTFSGNGNELDSMAYTEFDNCIFRSLDLTLLDFKNAKFIDCQFIECDLSNVKMSLSIFRDVKFLDCKMIGILFEACNTLLFSASFESANLSHSSFSGMKLNLCKFKDCKMEGVEFSEAVLDDVDLNNCDLLNACFEFTSCKGTIFSNSFNYDLDLDKNQVHGAVFSRNHIEGLLSKYNIIIE